MHTQVEMGCDPSKCRVVENGISYERLCDIPLKQDDGMVDIGAVVRLAPIKDIKTMIYAFFELAARKDNVRLHIMGGVDDQDYADECYALVKQLGLEEKIIFTGRVNIIEYFEKLDFTLLTSISEGQPLSVLESFAARRPAVTTDVGCCRELLNGKPGDTLGQAGYFAPPMQREKLADAMERLCESRELRIKMGEIGQKRAYEYFRYEIMLAKYKNLYKEVENEWPELVSN
jgi:glycosyltransferase involved in cell wall biosynthesis